MKWVKLVAVLLAVLFVGVGLSISTAGVQAAPIGGTTTSSGPCRGYSNQAEGPWRLFVGTYTDLVEIYWDIDANGWEYKETVELRVLTTQAWDGQSRTEACYGVFYKVPLTAEAQ